MPRLTVLLSVRNGAPTVRRAVTSTLRALPRDAELAVLDDGSTDDTLTILTSIDHPALRVRSGPGSGGLSHALNDLLAHTDSEWVARMDADDICLPGRFRSGPPGRTGSTGQDLGSADLEFAGAVTFGSRQPPRPSVPVALPATVFPYHLLLTNPVRHGTLTARRSALSDLGGYRPSASEDYDLWLRAAQSGKRLVRRSRYAIGYRVHADQITSATTWRTASHQDPYLAESFGELSSTLLGTPLPRLVALAAEPRASAEPRFAEFSARFTAATHRLPRSHRTLLQARLQRRARDLRRSWTTADREGVR